MLDKMISTASKSVFRKNLDAKEELAIIWFVGSFLLFIFMMLLSAGDKFHELEATSSGNKIVNNGQIAWEWFLPTVFPTLSLIASAYIHDGTQKKSYKMDKNSSLFSLTKYTSIFYLSIIFFTLILTVVAEAEHIVASDWLLQSNIWIAPLQGLTVGVMGAYFINRTPSAENIATQTTQNENDEITPSSPSQV